jgi:hypothetical protein
MLERPETIFLALSVVRSAGASGIIPRDFAARMWPDSRVWRIATRTAYMATAGGALLGRLGRFGYVARYGRGRWARHTLTAQGAAFLGDFARDLMRQTCPR